jgi:hypothetical protein
MSLQHHKEEGDAARRSTRQHREAAATRRRGADKRIDASSSSSRVLDDILTLNASVGTEWNVRENDVEFTARARMWWRRSFRWLEGGQNQIIGGAVAFDSQKIIRSPAQHGTGQTKIWAKFCYSILS